MLRAVTCAIAASVALWACPTDAAEQWLPTSRTSVAITGTVSFAADRITFANGQSLPLAAAGTVPDFEGKDTEGTLFRVTKPADPSLLQGSHLCGRGQPVTFIVVWKPNGSPQNTRAMAAFTSSEAPLRSTAAGFCGSYYYEVRGSRQGPR